MHVMKECSVLVNVVHRHSVFDTIQLILSSSLDPSLCDHHGSPGRGEGREPPGTHGARRRPGVSPGSGLTETATGPGSTLTARGGADSLWLQRFAFLKLQPLDTVEL